MRVLGVDLGMKRTGVAVSDSLGISVRALETFTPGSRAADVERLVGHVTELEVTDVVIGLPVLPKSGEDTPWSRRVRGFAAALKAALAERDPPVGVHLVDESYSSRRAAERLVAAGVKKSQRKARLDMEVACGLVEEFLAARG